MQAAVTRLSSAEGHRRADKLVGVPHIGSADDSGLLDALPIAAAIIERTPKGELKVAAHNKRFTDAVQQSSCTALNCSRTDLFCDT